MYYQQINNWMSLQGLAKDPEARTKQKGKHTKIRPATWARTGGSEGNQDLNQATRAMLQARAMHEPQLGFFVTKIEQMEPRFLTSAVAALALKSQVPIRKPWRRMTSLIAELEKRSLMDRKRRSIVYKHGLQASQHEKIPQICSARLGLW